MKQDFDKSVFWRYSKWADKVTDDYNEPLLYNMAKMFVFIVLPMLLMFVLFLVAFVATIAVAVQIVPWVWNLVWV